MKNFVKFLFFITLVAGIQSCKKDETTVVPPPAPFCHRTSVTVDYVSSNSNNHYQKLFTFNANGQLINDGTDVTYTWADREVVRRDFYGKTTYTLDGAGRAINETHVDAAQNFVYNRTFQYDANGYLTIVNQTGSYAHSKSYQWMNGNLSKVINTTLFGDTITHTYTYDLQLVTPASYTVLPIFGKESKNLEIHVVGIYSFGGYWTTSDTQYELDQYGNVKKSIVNFVDTGVASTWTSEYFYEGCE